MKIITCCLVSAMWSGCGSETENFSYMPKTTFAEEILTETASVPDLSSAKTHSTPDPIDSSLDLTVMREL